MNKIERKKAVAFFSVITLSITLAGCGGGGSSAPSNSSAPNPTSSPAPVTTSAPTPVTTTSGPTSVDPNYYTHSQIASDFGFGYANNNGYTGAGVTLAVIDSGLATSAQEFAGINPIPPSAQYSVFMQSTTTGSSTTYSYIYNKDGALGADPQNHGSAVSALIFGQTYGFAPDVQPMFIGDAIPNTADQQYYPTLQALITPVMQQSPSVINMSKSGCEIDNEPTYSSALSQQKDFAPINQAGDELVCAAGNQGQDLTKVMVSKTVSDTKDMPNPSYQTPWAKVTGFKSMVIMAGAIDIHKQLDGYSNYPGSDPDMQARFLVAPGDVQDIHLKSDNKTETSTWWYWTGTSFSAPLVSAAIADLMSAKQGLTAQQAAQALLDTADKNFTGYDPAKYGQGIIDVKAALQKVLAMP